MSLPPRYSLIPTALFWMSQVPVQLRWTYIVLYALAWNHDYSYVTESLEEMAQLFDQLEKKRITARIMRYRINGLIAHGLIERRRSGRRYITHLLVRHDKAAPEIPTLSIEEQIEADLPRGKPGGRVSCADEFCYDILDELDCDYVPQFHPPGCPYWFDLFLPDLNLLVELDSAYWHRGQRAKQKGTIQKDRRKDAWARDHGYDLVRLQINDIRDASERNDLRRQMQQLIEEEGDPELSLTLSPSRAPNSNNVVDDVSLSDQERHQQHQYSNMGDVEENERILIAMGIDAPVSRRLAREPWVNTEYLGSWMAYRASQAARGNFLGPGYMVTRIGSGAQPPVEWERDLEEEGDRYVRGKYRDYIQS